MIKIDICEAVRNFGSYVLVMIDGSSLTSHKLDGNHPDVFNYKNKIKKINIFEFLLCVCVYTHTRTTGRNMPP